jgi:nitrate reductase assembly molybdenum cofactor insertion protein NarJ
MGRHYESTSLVMTRYVPTGEVEKAVALLLNEWASMCGTAQDQGYAMAQLKSGFDKYVQECSN